MVQQPQVVFLQPVVSRQASPASKDATSRHKRAKKYLPILKSYPKIAPHPGDGSSSSGRGTSSLCSSSSSSSSSFSGVERCSTSTSSHREHCQKEKPQRGLCGSASNSGSATPSLPSTPSSMSPLLQSHLSLPTTEASSSPSRERPSSVVSQPEFMSFTHTTGSNNNTLPVALTETQEDISLGECNLSDGESDSKRKRFCNTYNILSKSGLLDITLRTKELLRQNRRTQSDLDRLKEHTDLFLQALQSGDTSILVKLQASLQEEEKEKGFQTTLKAD